MSEYDRLPREIRRALANNKHNICTRCFTDALREYQRHWTETLAYFNHNIDMIQRQDDKFVDRIRRYMQRDSYFSRRDAYNYGYDGDTFREWGMLRPNTKGMWL